MNYLRKKCVNSFNPNSKKLGAFDIFEFSEFKDGNYFGRLLHCWNYKGANPRYILRSNSTLWKTQDTMKKFKEGQFDKKGGLEMRKLIHCKRILASSTTHLEKPSTIPRIFRLSFSAPVSSILTTLMLTFQGSLGPMVATHLLYQAHRAMFNHYYRSRDNEPTKKTAINMTAAIVAATGNSFAIWHLTKIQNFSTKFPLLYGMVPFLALATAEYFNLMLVRRHEISKGITVTSTSADGKKKLDGISKIAAKTAFRKNYLARLVRIGIAVGSTQMLYHGVFVPKLPGLVSSKVGSVTVQFLMQVLFQFLAVPIAYSMFQDKQRAPAEYLESEFHGKTFSDRTKACKYTFNKGM